MTNIIRQIREFVKKEAVFIAFLTFIIFFFFWKFIFLKESFLAGDYRCQLFPWSMAYAESIKNLSLPLWTSYFHCGFPLFAEGQVAALYPLNIIMFLLLPPMIAYTYNFVLHFIIAGIFMYMFTRSLGLKNIAAIIPVFLFLFGSFYAGIFYNVTTLRTLVWFPLVLFLMNKAFDSKRARLLYLSGIIIGVQFLGGSMQLALYSVGMYFLYLIFLIAENGHKLENLKWSIKALLSFIAAVVIAFVISSPQIIATNTLVNLSNRSIVDINFALWGSFLPVGLVTLIFPHLATTFGGSIYIGVIPFFFAIIAVFNIKNRHIRFFIVMFLITFALALGKYNPLYVLFLKITHLYAFRNPSKFLFFSGFSLAVLAGFGFDYLINKKATHKISKKINTILIGVSSLAVLFYLSANIIMRIAREWIISFGKWYASKFIYGAMHHRHSLQYYLNKVESFYSFCLDILKLTNPYFITAVFLLFSGTIVITLWYREKLKQKLFQCLVIVLIFADIWIFSFHGTGFRGNMEPIHRIYKKSEIVNFLNNDRSLYRVYAFKAKEINEDIWGLPNFNMFYHISEIGAYSPLVIKRYYDLLEDFGCVDDSLGIIPPKDGIIDKRLGILSMLNVKYIVTTEELQNPFLRQVHGANDTRIYLNNDVLSRAYFAKRIKVIEDETKILEFMGKDNFSAKETVILGEEISAKELPEENSGEVEIERYSNDDIILKTNNLTDGMLVLADTYYPGWKAFIDGNETKIYRANYILRAIYVPKGKYLVEFKYRL